MGGGGKEGRLCGLMGFGRRRPLLGEAPPWLHRRCVARRRWLGADEVRLSPSSSTWKQPEGYQWVAGGQASPLALQVSPKAIVDEL